MTIFTKPGRSQGISRREILMAGAAMGATALAGPLSVGRALAQSTPKQGGVLRIGLSGGTTGDNVDPAVAFITFTQLMLRSSNAYLVDVQPDGSLQGELAESWEGSSDAKTWTFRLRPGVQFHNGNPVTVDDVIASLNYHRGPDSTSAVKNVLATVVDIRADGDNVVVFTLDAGNVDFPVLLSDYHLLVRPSQDGKIDPFDTIGAGPFVLDSFEPGVGASLSRNTNYFKPGLPYFDGVELIAILDPAARQNALMSGQVDVIDDVDLATVHLLERAPGVKVMSLAGKRHFTFPMDTRADPFSDNNVRMALKHAIDREELVEKILRGYGSVGNDQPITPSMAYFDASAEQRVYDPDKAKWYLQQSGLDSLAVDLNVANAAFPGAIDAALLFSEKASAAGIRINVVREPDDGYWSNVWSVKPFTATYWDGRPTQDWQYSTAYSADAAWNDTFWKHERFNELLAAARIEFDEARRFEMYAEMQALIRNEGGAIIPMFANYTSAMSEKIGHPEVVGANFPLDGHRAAERWWFA